LMSSIWVYSLEDKNTIQLTSNLTTEFNPVFSKDATADQKNKFYKEEVQPAGKITISLGSATFPDDGNSFEDLIQKSDEALYQAKSMGRNQMRIY